MSECMYLLNLYKEYNNNTLIFYLKNKKFNYFWTCILNINTHQAYYKIWPPKYFAKGFSKTEIYETGGMYRFIAQGDP